METASRLTKLLAALLATALALMAVTLASPPTGYSVNLEYIDGETAGEKATQQWLSQTAVVESAIELINEQYRLTKPVTVIVGAQQDASFDSETGEIALPYAFVTEAKRRFSGSNYGETGVSPSEATEHVVLHTMFHELAHALIEMNNLPVLGREEDAADALATTLLIEFFDHGQELALSAADLFDLESTDRDEFIEDDFFGEHSLDEQRYYSVLCHVYGSAPENYQHLVDDEGGLTEERAETCIYDYQQISDSWLKVLKPFQRG